MKKVIMIVTMLLVPAIASAWTMPVKVTNTSAGIAAGNKATVTVGTTSTDVTAGTRYFYPASSVASVTVTLGQPASVTSVKVNGTAPAGYTLGDTSFTVTKGAASLYSVDIVYANPVTVSKQNITVNQTAGGLTSIAIGSSVTTTGFTGVPKGTVVTVKTQSNVGFAAGAPSVSGATLNGDSFVVGDSAVTVSATYAAAPTITSAYISAPALAVTGQLVKAVAVATTTGTPTYVFSVTGCTTDATKVVQNGREYTFSPTSTGTCTVTAAISLGGVVAASPSAAITVSSGLTNANYTCTACHSGSTPTIVTAYTASGHADASYSPTCAACHSSEAHAAKINAANVDPLTFKVISSAVSVTSHGVTTVVAKGDVFCAGCHNGTHAIPHPLTGLSNTCAGCHSSSGDAHGIKKLNHAFAVDPGEAANCATCHSNTAPHYGGQAFHKAQYTSSASLPVDCTNCHGSSVSTTANQAILRQFTSSSHGKTTAEAWIHYDWRGANRAPCQRCHAGTGFVAKLGNENSTANAYQGTDILKPGEVLNCSACHSDAATGAVRSAAQQFTITMTNGATVTYDVAGASTLCARCHSGRETGDSITADPGTTGIRGFIDSHYQPAAGTLYNKAGYEYAGQNYDSLGGHKLLGAAGQGPCVTCHMSGKNHALDAANCATCHNGTTAPVVNASTLKANYDAALNNLKLALEAKGIHYGPVHPFFYTAPYVAGGTNTPFTNWGSIYGAASWKDTMGAAFNYNLLWSEKGAYAHNYDYGMKLIADSIDFLNDGTVGQ